MAIIEVDHVTKQFNLGQMQSFKRRLERVVARLNGHQIPPREPFKALDDVDFKIDEGEVVGIIGSNGAGKSTLLKILSKITVPTRGSVHVRGRVAPLIEVGAGLVGDLTGRENIFLNGSILGMPKREIRRKLDEIIAFSELEEFIDTPVKRYSSGMSIRLGLSIAMSVDAEILIIDEVLAVGDLAFQRKCFDRMEDIIKRQGKTVLLVSHNIRQVERLCSRVLLLDHGRILNDGGAREICNLFYERSDAKIASNTAVMANVGLRMESGDVDLLEVLMLDKHGNAVTEIPYRSDVTFLVRYRVNAPVTRPNFGIGVHTTDFLYLTTDHTNELFDDLELTPGIHEARCHVKGFPLLPGVYALRVGLATGVYAVTAFYAENVLSFRVTYEEGFRHAAMREGFISWESEWDAVRLDVPSRAGLPVTTITDGSINQAALR